MLRFSVFIELYQLYLPTFSRKIFLCVQEFDHPHLLLQNKESVLYDMVEQTGRVTRDALHKIAELVSEIVASTKCVLAYGVLEAKPLLRFIDVHHYGQLLSLEAKIPKYKL